MYCITKVFSLLVLFDFLELLKVKQFLQQWMHAQMEEVLENVGGISDEDHHK